MNDDETVREELAAYAHDAWSGWMTYMFSLGVMAGDGSMSIPAWAVERWHRQMTNDYADLPEVEKESDRREADRMLTILEKDGTR